MQWLLPSCVCGLVVGVWIADRLDTAPIAAFGVLSAMGLCALFSALSGVRRSPWPALMVLGLGLGVLARQGAFVPEHGVPDRWLSEARPTIAAQGVVIDGSRPRPEGRHRAKIKLHSCDGFPCNINVLVSMPPDRALWSSGDGVVFAGRFRGPSRADSPWSMDGWRWMAQRRLSGSVSVGEGGCAAVVSPGSGSLDRWRQGRERAIRSRLGDGRAALVLAILTGSKGLATAARRGPVDEAGLSHLLAISGLHLMGVAGFLLWGLERAARRWPKGRSLWIAEGLVPAVAIAGVGIYAALVGWPVSARRAFVMLACLKAAGVAERPFSVPTALAAAVAVVVLGESPHAVFDPGLHLSVTAVGGLAMAAGPQGEGVWAACRSMISASLVSSAACAPWLVIHFGRLPLLGVFLNLAAIPIAGIGALGAGLIGLVFDWWPLYEVCWALLASVEWMSEVVPLSGVTLGMASAPGLVVGLVLAVAAAWRGRARLALCGLMVSAVLAGAAPPTGGVGAQIMFVPVGQGDAILLLDGRGASILVDGGGSMASGLDPGDWAIRPAMASLGLRRLDVIAVSHADADHIAGLPSAVRRFRPRQLWWDHPDPSRPGERALMAAADEVGAVVMPVPRRARVGKISVRRLDPVLTAVEARATPRNDRSAVLEVEIDGLRALLTGDIEAQAEWRLLPAIRPVHLLKVAHHGSKTSSTASFLKRARPELAVIQSGRGNRFGHPHADVVGRLEGVGATVLETADCGALVVRVIEGEAIAHAQKPCGPNRGPGRARWSDLNRFRR